VESMIRLRSLHLNDSCSYEEYLTDLMYQYSSNPWATHLDELEIFVGNIIGTNHNLSKRQREASSSMREGMPSSYLGSLDTPFV